MIQFDQSLHVSAMARLSLISSIILSLQNEANETGLYTTQSIVLNLTLGLWAFAGMMSNS